MFSAASLLVVVGVTGGRPPPTENRKLENRVEGFVARFMHQNPFVGDGSDDVVDDLCTYLDTSGAQRTSQLPEWEDFQELAEEYEVTL